MDSVRKCLCDEPTCGKCLGMGCVDDNCLIHKRQKKIDSRKRILYNLESSLVVASTSRRDEIQMQIERLKEDITRLQDKL